MPHTKANAMKFSKLRNWIGNNTVSISVSTHVHRTIHNFVSAPLVQEGEGIWTEKSLCFQFLYDFRLYVQIIHKSIPKWTS